MPPALITLVTWAGAVALSVWGVSEAADKAAESTAKLSDSIVQMVVALSAAVLAGLGAWAIWLVARK